MVGVLVNVLFDLEGRSVTGRATAVIALLAFGASLYAANAILIVLVALVAGALVSRPATGVPRPSGAAGVPVAAPEAAGRRRWAAIGAVVAAVLAVAGFAWARASPVGEVGLSMFKIGAVAFGNGSTIMPLLQAEAVNAHGWLTLRQFADGIALGQVTPGPFLITAAFIGFKVGGLAGAALATFGIFAPSFAMTLIFTEVFGRVRDLRAVRGALAGVLASFVGLLAVVTLQLGPGGADNVGRPRPRRGRVRRGAFLQARPAARLRRRPGSVGSPAAGGPHVTDSDVLAVECWPPPAATRRRPTRRSRCMNQSTPRRPRDSTSR